MVYACNGFCNTMEIPVAILWNFDLQLSVFLSYNKQPEEIFYTTKIFLLPLHIRQVYWFLLLQRPDQ